MLPLPLVSVAAVVVLVLWPVLYTQAICFDDGLYVFDSDVVQHPSWAGLGRVWSEILSPSRVPGYYHPLTSSSLMLDCLCGGTRSNLLPFRASSLTIHVLNTLLVSLLLWSLFREPWTAALCALLFGVHPLAVEPIAWIGQRKALVSTMFALASLCCFARRARCGRLGWLLAALVALTLALLSKPTALVVPIMMLVIGFWPLRLSPRKALIEVIPFLILAGVIGWVIMVSHQRTAGITASTTQDYLLLPLRVGYQLAFYLRQVFWPRELTRVYDLPEPMSLANPAVAVGVAVTTGLTLLVLAMARRHPAPLCGWLVFIIGLAPTLGAVKYSWVKAFDNYAYFPMLGPLYVLAWMGAMARGATVRRPGPARVALLCAMVILSTAASLATRREIAHWRDTETLARHMLRLNPQSPRLNVYLANELMRQRRFDEAASLFWEATRLDPLNAEAHSNLGQLYTEQGRPDLAIQEFETALRVRPRMPQAWNNRGRALLAMGRIAEAIDAFTNALEQDADLVEARNNRAIGLAYLGRVDAAIRECQLVLATRPDYAEAHNNLGIFLATAGRDEEAIPAFREALRLRPEYAVAAENLADALARLGRVADAAALYRDLLRADPNGAKVRQKLEQLPGP